MNVKSATGLMALCLFGCGRPGGEPAIAFPGGSLAEGTGYTLQIPEGWTKSVGVSMADLVAVAPPESGSKFASNVNVVIERLPSQMSVEDYFRTSMKMMGNVSGYQHVDDGDARLGSIAAKWLVWEHTMMSQPLRVLTYLATDGEKGYIITCTATPGSFNKIRPTFEQIAQSFRLK